MLYYKTTLCREHKWCLPTPSSAPWNVIGKANVLNLWTVSTTPDRGKNSLLHLQKPFSDRTQVDQELQSLTSEWIKSLGWFWQHTSGLPARLLLLQCRQYGVDMIYRGYLLQLHPMWDSYPMGTRVWELYHLSACQKTSESGWFLRKEPRSDEGSQDWII